MTRGPIVALKLEGANAIPKWRELMGPTKHAQAMAEAPNCIRALYGTDTTQNASHGSDSVTSAARELNFFFKQQVTLALFKPDVVRNGSGASDDPTDRRRAVHDRGDPENCNCLKNVRNYSMLNIKAKVSSTV